MDHICVVCDKPVKGRFPPYLSLGKAKACPSCGTSIIPGRPDDFVDVRIRWQELRVLFTLANVAIETNRVDDYSAIVLRRLINRVSPLRPAGLPPLTVRQLVDELKLQGVDVEMVDFDGKPWPMSPPLSSDPDVEQGQ